MPDIVVLYSDTAAHPMVLEEKHVEMLRKVNRSGLVRLYKTESEFLNDPMDAEILITWGRDTPEKVCEKMPGLKWIQSISAGVEGLQLLTAAKPPLILSKMKNVHGIPMSESVMLYILSFLNGMPRLRENQRAHVWKKPMATGSNECAHKIVGIIGIGDIGSHVADKCRYFGMKVLGCRRNPVSMKNVDEMYPLDKLHEMLPRCDFVVDLVPATPEAYHMIDEKCFKSMKSSAVFINVGRGSTVDTQALVEALQNGEIAGAALDALEQEPLPEDSPLWDMDNVIITPHCCADSPYYFDRAIKQVCENIVCYQNGLPVPTAVKY